MMYGAVRKFCPVELKGRGCREKMDRILTKYKEEDMKALKR